MKFRHYLEILRRRRGLVLGGLVLAGVLGTLVSFSVTSSGLDWRSEATFASESQTFVTQAGFPWGRTTLPGSDPTEIDPLQQAAPDGERRKFAPPSRFTELATIYSHLAQSDVVRRLITPIPDRDQIVVWAVPNPTTGDTLPLLMIRTTANSSRGAQALNRSAIEALREYLEVNIRQGGVPADQRVRLQVLTPPGPGVLAGGRSITLSLLVALLVLVGTAIAVYLLESVYPSAAREESLDPLEYLDFDLYRDGSWEPADQLSGKSTQDDP